MIGVIYIQYDRDDSGQGQGGLPCGQAGGITPGGLWDFGRRIHGRFSEGSSSTGVS